MYYHSHISSLRVWPIERGSSLWRLLSADGQESIRQTLRCPAPFVRPIWLSAISLSVYLPHVARWLDALNKHAAWLLIVNQIQFVPLARYEWASLPRTKVSEKPCQSWTKSPQLCFLSQTTWVGMVHRQPLNEELFKQDSKEKAFTETCCGHHHKICFLFPLRQPKFIQKQLHVYLISEKNSASNLGKLLNTICRV